MEKDRIVHNEILGMKGLQKIFNDICLKICTLIRWKMIVFSWIDFSHVITVPGIVVMTNCCKQLISVCTEKG